MWVSVPQRKVREYTVTEEDGHVKTEAGSKVVQLQPRIPRPASNHQKPRRVSKASPLKPSEEPHLDGSLISNFQLPELTDSITIVSCHQFVQIYEHGPRRLINNQSSTSFTGWENVWMFDLKQNTHFCSPWSMLPYDALRKSQVALQLFFQPSKREAVKQVNGFLNHSVTFVLKRKIDFLNSESH